MTTMPGKAELVAQLVDVGRDHAEVLGDHGQLAELRARRRGRPPHPGPCAQWPVARRLGVAGTAQ